MSDDGQLLGRAVRRRTPRRCLTVLASAEGLLPDERIIIAMRLTAAAKGVAVLVAYARLAWRSARLSRLRLSAEVSGYRHLPDMGRHGRPQPLALTWRLSGRPAWMIDSELNGLWLFMIVLGGMFLLAAPGAIDGQIPRRNQIVLGIVAGASVFFVLLLGVVSGAFPTVAAWLERVGSGAPSRR